MDGPYHREGMGLLEYQVVPSLNDGWLCTFTIYQQLEIPSARSWAAPARATGTVWTRQAVRPFHHVQNPTCRVTILQPARRAAVLGQPSSLQTHWYVPPALLPVPSALLDRSVCPGRSCSAVSWRHFQLLLYWKCTEPIIMTKITLGGLGPVLHVYSSLVANKHQERAGIYIAGVEM